MLVDRRSLASIAVLVCLFAASLWLLRHAHPLGDGAPWIMVVAGCAVAAATLLSRGRASVQGAALWLTGALLLPLAEGAAALPMGALIGVLVIGGAARYVVGVLAAPELLFQDVEPLRVQARSEDRER